MELLKKETLLGLAMFAIAGGIVKVETDLQTGVVLVLIGVGLITLRARLKLK